MCLKTIEADCAVPSQRKAWPGDAMALAAVSGKQPQPAIGLDRVADLQSLLSAQQGLWASRRVRSALLEDLGRRPPPPADRGRQTP